MMALDRAIGIDLGTANTCVAVYGPEGVEIIPDEDARHIPSCVAFTPRGSLVGAAAKRQSAINARHTISGALRFFGRRFHDPEVITDAQQFGLQLREQDGMVVFEVNYKDEDIRISAEEVVSMILTRAKDNAEAYLGTAVNHAVITHPAYWNHSQRRRIRDVASNIGLNVLYLVGSSTAAAVTHAFSFPRSGEQRLLFVDVGAGTCDVTLAIVEEGIIEVKATAGDNHLGGDDFDNRLVRFMLNKHGKEEITHTDPRRLRRLRSACEYAKRDLSSHLGTVAQLDNWKEGQDLKFTLTRLNFEALCRDLIYSILLPIERVLRDAKMDKSSIQDIVLLGGSARTPYMERMLSDFFNGKEMSKILNFDESAAYGAALLAAIFSGNDRSSSKLMETLLLDVVPISVGIEYPPTKTLQLLKRNTTKPTKRTEPISIEERDFPYIVEVLEGERVRAEDNDTLGKFELPLSGTKTRRHHVEVMIDVDNQGNLVIEATDKTSRTTRKLHLPNTGQIPVEELFRMRRQLDRFRRDQQNEVARVAERVELESRAYSVKEEIRTSKLEDSVTEDYVEFVDEVIDWLNENPSLDAEHYRLRREELDLHFRKLWITTPTYPSKPIDHSDSSASITTDRPISPQASEKPTQRDTDRRRRSLNNAWGSQDRTSKSNEPPGSAKPLNLPEEAAVGSPSSSNSAPRAKSVEPVIRTVPTTHTPSSPLWLPLRPTDFRLLYFDKLRGVFTLKSHRMEYPPRYRALSYVWGTQAKDRKIACTNQNSIPAISLNISKTLQEALTELAPSDTPIWVDTICINQADDTEKSKQVASLHRIFRRAEQVIIWLGREDEDTALAMDVAKWLSMPPGLGLEEKQLQFFPTLKDYLQQKQSSFHIEQLQRLATVASRSQQIPINQKEFARLGLPQFDDGIWRCLGTIFSAPWLFRLWTFQELMLSKDCLVAFGSSRLPWRAYFDVGMQFSLCGLLDHCHNRLGTPSASKARALTAFTRLDKFWSTRQEIVPFWKYLDEARHRDVTEPVDRIYAVLSLANEKLRSRIKVDYSSTWKQRYWELFMEASKAIMAAGTLQTILSSVNSRTKAVELPSWCPDFTAPCEVAPFGEYAKAGNRFGKSWTPHYDRAVINVGGAQVDTVDRIIASSWVWSQSLPTLYGPAGLADQNLKWLDRCWTHALESYGDDEAGAHRAFVFTILGQVPHAPTVHDTDEISTDASLDAQLSALDEELTNMRHRLEDFTMSHGADGLEEDYAQWHEFHIKSNEYYAIWKNRVFFTTRNGKIGFASDRISPGDQICLFFGESHMYILRSREDGFHQFVSDAYVDGYMAGEGADHLPQSRAFKIN